ncbi:MAG: GNAT family N-acetyltransferase [Shimia sp.]
MTLTLGHGLREDEREAAAALFWEAFGPKLGRLMGPDDRARAFLAEAIRPTHAIAARDGGALIGLAGLKDRTGGFVGGGWGEMWRHYGASALWRGPLLDSLDRPLAPGQLLMDGLCVTARARSGGVGAALLGAIEAHARGIGCHTVRLDVVDGNDRARALYERLGYRVVGHHGTGLLGPLMGFPGASEMAKAVPPR